MGVIIQKPNGEELKSESYIVFLFNEVNEKLVEIITAGANITNKHVKDCMEELKKFEQQMLEMGECNCDRCRAKQTLEKLRKGLENMKPL